MRRRFRRCDGSPAALSIGDARPGRHPSAVPRRARRPPSSASCASGSCGVTREAIETYGMARPRRSLAGLPLGRQGQLHAARGADRTAVARAAAGRAPRLQPRPGPAGVSGDGAAGVPGPDGRAAPDRVPGHLFGRRRQGARRARPTARSARGSGAATSTASPARRAARPSCSATTATTSSRPSSSTSSTAASSRRCRRSSSTTRATSTCCARSRTSPRPTATRFARAMGYPIIPCDLCGSQDGLQRQADQARCSTNGSAGARDGGRSCSARSTQANPSHLLDPSLFDFKGLQAGQGGAGILCTRELGLLPLK